MPRQAFGCSVGLLIVAAIFLSACGGRRESAPSKEASWPEDRREEIAYWDDQARTKTVRCASGTTTVRVEWLDERRVCFHFDEGKQVSMSRAAVITADGYALTAAHAVSVSESLWALIRGGLTARCRIVWRSNWSASDPTGEDWALIRIDHGFSELCEWSAQPPAAKDAVIATGEGIPSFGRVDWVSSFNRDDRNWQVICHSAPIAGGDSGGALLNDDGRLLGIHFAADPGDVRTYAIRPDPTLVAQLIAEDRRTRALAGDGTPVGSGSQAADPQPDDGGETTPLNK